MFLHFKNANTMYFKKSLYSIVVKKMYTKLSSVHGSSVLTVRRLERFVSTFRITQRNGNSLEKSSANSF